LGCYPPFYPAADVAVALQSPPDTPSRPISTPSANFIISFLFIDSLLPVVDFGRQAALTSWPAPSARS